MSAEQVGWAELGQYVHVVTDRGTAGVRWWRACEPHRTKHEFTKHPRGRSIFIHPVTHQPRSAWMCETCPWPPTTKVIKRGDHAAARHRGHQLRIELRSGDPPDDAA